MKIRSGFVSNSSSSSFIVGLPKIPSSPEELQKAMFGDKTEVEYYDETFSCKDIAKRVYDDITTGTAKPLTKAKALKVLEEGTFQGYPKYKWGYFNKKSEKFEKDYQQNIGKRIYGEPLDSPARKKFEQIRQDEWAAERLVVEAAARAYLEGFWPTMKGKKAYRFEYADDSGEAVFEHGNIFRAFPHTQVSKH